jgi:hypothetical protein
MWWAPTEKTLFKTSTQNLKTARIAAIILPGFIKSVIVAVDGRNAGELADF